MFDCTQDPGPRSSPPCRAAGRRTRAGLHRAEVLRAARRVAAAGDTITVAALRAAGVRGNERAITAALMELVRGGEIDLADWNRGRDHRLRLGPGDVRDDAREAAMARDVGRCVADYRRAWARIRGRRAAIRRDRAVDIPGESRDNG